MQTNQTNKSNMESASDVIKIVDTVGDGNCLIHALYGTLDDFGQISLSNAADYRTKTSEQLLEFVNKNPDMQEIKLKTFMENSNAIAEEEKNINDIKNLALSLRIDKEYLGLEHADLIAQFYRLNIRVYNEKTRQTVDLFYNQQTNDPTHLIAFNGVNHWSRYRISYNHEKSVI